MPDLTGQLLGTLRLRPYVFFFLLVYYLACSARYGGWSAVRFLILGYGIAFCSEYASIHWGIPYGRYYYLPVTKGRELWIAGVPFMDSLSYVFLTYAGFSTALLIRGGLVRTGRTWRIHEAEEWRNSAVTALLSASLILFLDVIVDPVALRGDRWFLEKIYGYPEEGFYFGVPLSNFAGWFVVGYVLTRVLQWCTRHAPAPWKGFRRMPGIEFWGPALYATILLGNTAVAFWIGERTLGLAGTAMSLALTATAAHRVWRKTKQNAGKEYGV